MTDLLLRLALRGREDCRSAEARARVGSLSGAVGIGANALLFAGKLLAGLLTGSVSITADAMNNLSDASSSIVTLLGFRLAQQPPDEDHPYGHARFEYLSGLAVAVMIMLIGFELAKSSVEKILNPAAVEFSGIAAAVLLGSICVKLLIDLGRNIFVLPKSCLQRLRVVITDLKMYLPCKSVQSDEVEHPISHFFDKIRSFFLVVIPIFFAFVDHYKLPCYSEPIVYYFTVRAFWCNGDRVCNGSSAGYRCPSWKRP